MPWYEISDCAQMSKTIIVVRHFGPGGRESLETAVRTLSALRTLCISILNVQVYVKCFNFANYVKYDIRGILSRVLFLCILGYSWRG